MKALLLSILTILSVFSSGCVQPDSNGDFNGLRTERRPIIWYYNTAVPKRYDMNSLDEALQSGVFSHVMAAGMHPADDVIYGKYRPDMKKFTKYCKRHKANVIWKRCLWPTWVFDDFKIEDVQDKEYYKKLILQIKREAKAMGARYTAIGAEPYSKMLSERWKWKPLEKSEYDGIKRAIKEATDEVGKVDIVLPCYGWFDGHLYNATKEIGRFKLTTWTYYNLENRWKCSDPENANYHKFNIHSAYVNTITDPLPGTNSPLFTPKQILEDKKDDWNILFFYERENNVSAIASLMRNTYNPPIRSVPIGVGPKSEWQPDIANKYERIDEPVDRPTPRDYIFTNKYMAVQDIKFAPIKREERINNVIIRVNGRLGYNGGRMFAQLVDENGETLPGTVHINVLLPKGVFFKTVEIKYENLELNSDTINNAYLRLTQMHNPGSNIALTGAYVSAIDLLAF